MIKTMKLKDELNSKQKLRLARRLELIFNRSYVARVLGLNLRQFDDYKYKPMTRNKFKKGQWNNGL